MAEDSGDNKVTLSSSDLDSFLERAMGKLLESFEERLDQAVTKNVSAQLAKLNLTRESKDAEILSRGKQPLGEERAESELPLGGREELSGGHDAKQGNLSVAQLLNVPAVGITVAFIIIRCWPSKEQVYRQFAIFVGPAASSPTRVYPLAQLFHEESYLLR